MIRIVKGLDGGIQEGEVIKKEPVFIFGKKESLGKVGTLGVIPPPPTEMPFAETPSVELPPLRLVPVGNKRNLK